MIINRETDYALRILRELADGNNHSVVEICEKGQIPQAFAYKIIKKMQKKGFITVCRGAKGGCKMGRPFSQISLYDVICAVSLDSNISPCMDEGYDCIWRAANGICAIHNNLAQIQAKLNQELKSYSVEQLVSAQL